MNKGSTEEVGVTGYTKVIKNDKLKLITISGGR